MQTAFAQERKPARIVILWRGAGTAQGQQARRDALRELGQVEGQSYVFEPCHAGGDPDRLGELALEVVRSKPYIILAMHGRAATLAKAATSTIPIVFSAVDPVAVGLVASLARPGGNVTGVASLQNDLASKRLALLRDAMPSLRRVALLHTGVAGSNSQLEACKAAAATLKIEILPLCCPATPRSGRPSCARFSINLRTARALGLNIPKGVLLQADRVID